MSAIIPHVSIKLSADESALEPKTSLGEKWYNGIVYTGVNYWANLGVSLVAADYFTNLAGRKHLDKVIGLTEKLLTKTGLSSGTAGRTAKIACETMALTSGGWMATIATKPLEDHKREIVHWLNKKLGVDQTKADGTEAKPDEIYIEEEQPRQSWFNIIKRRVYASVVIIGASHVMEHTVGQKNVTNAVVDNVNAALKSGYIPFGKKLANNATFERYLGFAALDTMFTAIHALTMNLTTGAKKAHMPHEQADPAPAGVQNEPNKITILSPEAQTRFADKFASRASLKPDPASYKKEKPAPAESRELLAAKAAPNLAMAL